MSDQKAIHIEFGPVDIDIPETLGYYGGLGAAVLLGVLEPPVAAFIAAVPLIKMLGTSAAPTPINFLGRMLQGAAKPVGSDGEGTVRLRNPQQARSDIRRMKPAPRAAGSSA